ncbi:HK97 gp10 family phage protein [Aerococcaceae bacterium NML191219]|nr:HK97 gp10 family phage protein [Aerococcaceae bacterium NML191219]
MTKIVVDKREEFGRNVEQAMKAAIKAACLHNESAVKLATPVDGGLLRDSNSHRIKKTGDGYEGQVGNPVEYAPFVHDGTGEFSANGKGRKGGWAYVDDEGKGHFTRGQRPTHFIRDPMRHEKANTKKIIKDTFRRLS